MEVKRKFSNTTMLVYQESSNWFPNQHDNLQRSVKSKTSISLRDLFFADNFREKIQHIMNHDTFTWIPTQ